MKSTEDTNVVTLNSRRQVKSSESPLFTVGDLIDQLKKLPRDTPFHGSSACSSQLFNKEIKLQQRALWYHPSKQYLLSNTRNESEVQDLRDGGYQLIYFTGIF